MTVDASDTQEFIKLFIKLAKKSISLSKRNVALLQAQEHSKKRIEDLERAFHTLKGQAGVLKYQKFAKACSGVEELLRKARETDAKPSERQLEDIVGVLSYLQGSIASIEKTGKESD